MVPTINIYRSAKLLLEKRGEGAAIEAAMKADPMLNKGDIILDKPTLGL